MLTIHKPARFLILLAVFCCLLTSALPQHVWAEAQKQAFQQDPKDGLRDCFLSFQEDMINYEQGELKNPDDIFDLLQRPEYINEDREFTYLLKAAKRLFLITQSLIFDFETDIPDAPTDSDSATVTLYTEERRPVTFVLVKNQAGKWVFSGKTLEDKKNLELYQEIHDQHQKLTKQDMEGDTFDAELMSPYRTMLTLRAGVLGLYGHTLDDAATTLDLSELEPVLQKELGRTFAARLYRVLLFESPLDVEQLSANPHTETTPVFLMEPGHGVISMHVVMDENNIKAWKFTPKSLNVIRESYDKNITTIRAKGEDPFIGKNLPVDILVDDFIQSHVPVLEKELFKIDLWKYVIFGLLLLVTPLLLWGVRFISTRLLAFLRPRSSGSLTNVPDRRVVTPLVIISATYLWASALILLVTSEDHAAPVLVALHIVLTLAEVWLAVILVWLVAQWISARSSSRTGGTIALVIGQVLRILIVLIGLIEVASIFGQDSTRVLAALGIGGVAIALAGKNTVENIFGTMMIVTTRPFAIGHVIIVDGIEGEVEHVGLRSTTIRTFYNSLITVPNSQFITSPVDNMGKREHRRFKTMLGVAYDTPPEKLVAFAEGLRELALQNPLIDSKRIYVHVNDFGPSSIDILLYIHLHVPGRKEELIARERYILDVVHLAKMLEVEFAFPTRTLYMRKEETPTHLEMGGERRGATLGREAVSLLLKEQKQENEENKNVPS